MAPIFGPLSDPGIFVPGVMALIFEPVLDPNILEIILGDFSKNCRSSQSAKPTANIRLYIRE